MSYSWNRENPGSCAEVDYVIARGPDILPVEVKAGTTGTLKSLHIFINERSLQTGVRINLDTPSMVRCKGSLPQGDSYDYDLLSIPCYLIGELDRLLDGFLTPGAEQSGRYF